MPAKTLAVPDNPAIWQPVRTCLKSKAPKEKISLLFGCGPSGTKLHEEFSPFLDTVVKMKDREEECESACPPTNQVGVVQ